MNSKEAVERIALWLGAQDLPVSRPAFLVHLRGWRRRQPVVVEADYFVPEGAWLMFARLDEEGEGQRVAGFPMANVLYVERRE